MARLGFMAILLTGLGLLFFIPLFTAREAYPAIFSGDGLWAFLISNTWEPLSNPPKYGILHAWLSTLIITGLSLAFAVPVGFGIGIFSMEIASPAIRTILQPCMELLAGIPSVVYGFFGYVTVVFWFEAHLGMPTGESLLAAALILSVMILPFIASTSGEAFRAVPHDLKEAALALGVTRWHMVRRIVLPKAASGMFAAVALGLARALGETLAVLILAGNSVAVPHSVLDRGQPLTALIATELGEAGVDSPKYHALFAAALVLMVVVISINTLVWTLKQRIIQHEV
jgi:phosphate ABC transporter permease protein PstC